MLEVRADSTSGTEPGEWPGDRNIREAEGVQPEAPDVEHLLQRREYGWVDPAVALPELVTHSGEEYLRKVAAGTLPRPPIMATIDVTAIELTDELAVRLTLTPQPFHDNPLGTMHGGILATMLDTVMACAVHATLPIGVGYTSLDVSVRFIRPVTQRSGPIVAEGRVVSRGRRIATAEGDVRDAGGRVMATGTTSCLIFERTEPSG